MSSPNRKNQIPAGYERDLTGNLQRISYYWWWKCRLPERRMHGCWVTARGTMNTIRVEFLDGFVVFTSRWAVRRCPI